MLSNLSRRTVRRSTQSVANRYIFCRHSSSHVTRVTLTRYAETRKFPWQIFAIASTAAALSFFDHNEPVQNQSTKRYSRNIRASYDLLEKTIGTGGFGHVVAGIHKETGEQVAVKFIRKNACSKARVVSEVDILRIAGEHPSIVSFYDFFEDDDNYYLIMEMARGGEVFDQLIQFGAYSEPHARNIIKSIADALSYLHQQRILHLDLKPENIMLSEAVNRAPGTEADADIGALIRVVDFGSAVKLDGTPAGVVKFGSGTVAYSAPELLQGKPANDKADVWSLGIILFILLRGFHPFDPFNDADDAEIHKRIEKNEYPLHEFTWEGLSKPARSLIAWMLNPDPSQRPSALQVLSHEWFLSEALSTALLEDTAENLRRFHRGRRKLKAILLAIMADLLPANVNRRISTLGSRRAAIRWLDYDNKEYVTVYDLYRASKLLGEGASDTDEQELSSSIRRRQTVVTDQDAQDLLMAAHGNPKVLQKNIRYQDLMHLLPPLCPGRTVNQGDFVYNVGEEDPYFYLLKEGNVSLMVPAWEPQSENPSGRLLNAVNVCKNGHFGHLELIEAVTDNRSRSHAAQCNSHKCQVYAIPPAEFSLLSDVFSPVASQLASKAETTAQMMTLVHLKSIPDHKVLILDHPTTVNELTRQIFPQEPVLLYVVDGQVMVQNADAQTTHILGPGRFAALNGSQLPVTVPAGAPPIVVVNADDKLAPSNALTSVDATILAVPFNAAKQLLESPGLHAIRHNLPS